MKGKIANTQGDEGPEIETEDRIMKGRGEVG